MQGQGHHGSFSRADTANFMAAIGPAFKAGFMNATPVSNADIAPTLAQIIGVKLAPVGKLQGRVISEALIGGKPVRAVAARHRVAAGRWGPAHHRQHAVRREDALFRCGGISGADGGAEGAGDQVVSQFVAVQETPSGGRIAGLLRMSISIDDLEGMGWRKVATGTWFYDRTVPMPASIWAKPARLASSRFDQEDQLDESTPIPATKDGYLYCSWPGNSGDHLTIEEAKLAASAAPLGPNQMGRKFKLRALTGHQGS